MALLFVDLRRQQIATRNRCFLCLAISLVWGIEGCGTRGEPPQMPERRVASTEALGCNLDCPCPPTPPDPPPPPDCPLTMKTCSNGTCVAKTACCPNDATTVSCNDGLACTFNDHCDGAGHCVGTAITCTSDACATRACNGTSTCTQTFAGPETHCDDGQACTLNDVCNGAGACIGSALQCPPTECATSSCVSGACVSTAKAGCRLCPDGTAIPDSLCCVDADCAPPASGQGTGKCVNSTCVVACNTTLGFNSCNGDCLAGCCPPVGDLTP